MTFTWIPFYKKFLQEVGLILIQRMIHDKLSILVRQNQLKSIIWIR